MPTRNFNRKKQNRRNHAHENRSVVLWLILFFPLGLSKMWRNRCNWRRSTKRRVSCGFAALAVALVAAVMLYPSPRLKRPEAVLLYGDEPVAAVYGPELPEDIVQGYSSTVVNSVVTSTGAQTDDTIYVYAAKDASCYHLGDCKYAFASAQKLTVYEAYSLGYKPCGLCNPPTYDASTGTVVEASANDEAETAAAGETPAADGI